MMGQLGAKRGSGGGIHHWIAPISGGRFEGTVCFCCHEQIRKYSAVTRRETERNAICFLCWSQWEDNRDLQLYELPRHRKMPKGELYVSSEE